MHRMLILFMMLLYYKYEINIPYALNHVIQHYLGFYIINIDDWLILIIL